MTALVVTTAISPKEAALSSEILRLIEQRIEKAFDVPVEELYEQATTDRIPNPYTTAVLRWHTHTIHAQDVLEQHQAAFRDHLALGEDITPDQALERLDLLEKVTTAIAFPPPIGISG